MTATIHLGDCREIIATLDDNSIHSIITDPPYELGFMGKKWDNSGIAYDVQLWTECLRVLKPGGHLLAFGGTRTYHRMASAIEDAGFEIRDSIHWLYGSGFPKSLDVSKAIDKAAGAKRTVQIGTSRGVAVEDSQGYGGIARGGVGITQKGVDLPVMAPATEAAKQWEGWGTALKPAHEPIVVARKPLIGTVAANVQQHGTGALNIDGARVGYQSEADLQTTKQKNPGTDDLVTSGVYGADRPQQSVNAAGRWPANVITDGSIEAEWVRYFYVAKASKAERNAGLDGLPTLRRSTNYGAMKSRECNVCGSRCKQNGRWPDCPHDDWSWVEQHEIGHKGGNVANTHPTVKPLALMRYLVRLVTPPGGIVLEPFAGSGTTLAAAILEGFDAIGCELTDDYLPIIEGRIAWAEEQMKPDPESLFNQ
jgi:site-specific DNA-methyltransferase (adenine-specific)